MIVLPIWTAYSDREAQQHLVVSDDPNAPAIFIPSVAERLDTQRVSWGIALLCVYAATSVYLLSPRVQSRMGRIAPAAALPPP
jgi:hypothetical protein